jgi:lauroyl/myristoyl acyltransferase
VGNIMDIPFFNHRSYKFAAGPVNLALRTGAPIHPVFVVKHGSGHNELIIEKRISLDPREDKQKTIIDCSKKIVNVLEKYVTQYPCHYGNEIFHEKIKIIADKTRTEQTGTND